MILQQWIDLAPKPKELQNGDLWNVFLSYRSINRSWVLNLYDVLKQIGHKVFLDQYELKAGDQLITRLEDALTLSQAGILIWSSNTGDSDWVRREYQVLERMAEDKTGFQFIPIKLDKCKLPTFAANRVFLDFASYPDGPNGGELLRLLYAVVDQPLSPEAVRFANDLDEESMVTSIRIEAAIKNGLPERILQLFEHGGVSWQVSAAIGCKAAEGLTKLGRNEDAIYILEKLMVQFPRAIRPKQLYALAMARRAKDGDLSKAQEVLGELYAAGERDPETAGIYARTWMDRYKKSSNQKDLKRSRDLYAEAFSKASDDYYTGINAASKSVLLGSPEAIEVAGKIAGDVQKIVGNTPWPEDYWKTATVAECLLIQQKFSEAAEMYQAAVDIAPTEEGSHKSTHQQAKLLLEKMGVQTNIQADTLKAFVHLEKP